MTCTLASALLGTGAAHAQNFPTKAIRMVTATPGGGADFSARALAQKMAVIVGRPVVVDNRGINSMQIVATAPADGYTILTYGSPMWLAPLMHETAWDPIKDFAPVIAATDAPNMLAIHPSVPAKSVKELIAVAKAKPGQLNYASGSPGSASHLGAELLKSMAGIDIVHVPFKGVGQALTGVLSNEAQVLLMVVSGVAPHVVAGRLRALAVTSAKPTKLAPGVPTVSESGVPGFEVGTIIGVFAPAGTPALIIRALNQSLRRVLESPDVQERFFATGVEVTPGPPETLAAVVKADIARFGKVVKDAGIGRK
ncbi:MAG TPA: tripartite tricarboxylate transporter substrate-binding protein [Burkholderiales bacterium]|nr:tripartite tricarboxylate transporter substrate-binding protein [Burkholderiales bacterium]